MGSQWPLAFMEFFVVLAFGIVWLVTEYVAKRAAKKYGSTDAPADTPTEPRS